MERPQARLADADRAERRRAARLGLRERGSPLISYLDTSALIKLLIDERETGRTQEIVGAATAVATSTVSYVEARAALARMRAGRRIDARTLRTARRDLDVLWLDMLSLPVDDQLLATAADLADDHSLRGYDSIHLASALATRGGDDVVFTCWDSELNAAARDTGLTTADDR